MSSNHTGLTSAEVLLQRKLYGSNEVENKQLPDWIKLLKSVVLEPLLLILLVTVVIYALLGEQDDAIILLFAIGFVAGISIFQESRSSRAEKALKTLLQPKTRVYRNDEIKTLNARELVVGDVFLFEDGNILPADALILECHDLSINESVLTGESASLYKGEASGDLNLYQGSLVLSGYGVARVVSVGINTQLGLIQHSLETIAVGKTPIQKQIHAFVKKMIQLGLVAFFSILAVQYYLTQNLIYALLKGLTLSMSLLPEEIPVAFSTFMALGALALYRKQVLIKNPMTVESLGAVTTICLDKTGTITENQMTLSGVYDLRLDQLFDIRTNSLQNSPVIEMAMWASEIQAFDPMEISLHTYYEAHTTQDLRTDYQMIREYPLSGNPPVMIHVYENEQGHHLIACKGGLESVITRCDLGEESLDKLHKQVQHLANLGHRVLAVDRGIEPDAALPQNSFDFKMEMLGLVSFIDPPKKDIQDTIRHFYQAGIRVKILSGDYPNTTLSIARQIGIRNSDSSITGEQVMQMNEQSLVSAIKNCDVFSRMFPEAKLALIQQMKKNGEVVAMTGDGVNDGPALKASNVGVAMGKRGSELAREAASIILVNDDISRMVDGIALGRRIYENLKKAIQYIISIHIPIVLIVTLPVIFFWKHTDFFQPIHVILLELIMGPTCSIVFENEPIEANAMSRPPREAHKSLFTWNELGISIVQGIIITGVCLALALHDLSRGSGIDHARSMLYACLIFSNIFLTLVNRSFTEPVWTTIRYKNALFPMITVISILALLTTLYYSPIQQLFRFETLGLSELLLAFICSFPAVFWIEPVKWFKRYLRSKALGSQI